MGIESEDVLDFASKIEAELIRDPDKDDWKDKDVWWFLGQLVKEVRLLDSKMSGNADADIFDKATSIAAYAMIMANLQKNKRLKSKKTKKK
ncbi:hypothetical protein LCGC14_0459350 [marine sediment metagenome]|uniref:dATP/dGTP diphosphohydrolase N-terminal domain-containing protein n=1 Tax=marine sediment metagenome TaxID=412755 RepID=A0A0F9V2D5_9ZZZZ